MNYLAALWTVRKINKELCYLSKSVLLCIKLHWNELQYIYICLIITEIVILQYKNDSFIPEKSNNMEWKIMHQFTTLQRANLRMCPNCGSCHKTRRLVPWMVCIYICAKRIYILWNFQMRILCGKILSIWKQYVLWLSNI